MRIVVLGAGGVGSVIGGRLQQHAETHGHEIALVARPAHSAAINGNGLVINDPLGTTVVRVRAVEHITELDLDPPDIVITTMKTQDTDLALAPLAQHAPGVGVACAQNGVENERIALRRFVNVYGICVILPAAFLEPGVVDASGTPHNGILDLGSYPHGLDTRAQKLAAAFSDSGLDSRPDPDIMTAKYGKLLNNLVNAIDALVADRENCVDLIRDARAEAIECYRAAGITWVDAEQDRQRREGLLAFGRIEGRERGGGSTWQSFVRGAVTTEVDWLNGEIVLLGRTHGIDTPVNEMLCAVTREAVAARVAPRSIPSAQLLARLAGVS